MPWADTLARMASICPARPAPRRPRRPGFFNQSFAAAAFGVVLGVDAGGVVDTFGAVDFIADGVRSCWIMFKQVNEAGEGDEHQEQAA